VPQPSSRAILWGGLALGVVLATGLCVALATQVWVVGSSEGGWTYPYVDQLTWAPILIGLGAVLAVAGILAIGIATLGRVLLSLFGAIAVATAVHWGWRSHAPFDLEVIFRSPGANSFHAFAQEVGPAELLARFERARRRAPLHAQSNMPGKTLLVHALERVTVRTDILPWLLIIGSNLGALLVFGLARELLADDRAALYAALLYLFTPARLFFFPIMNTVTPVLVVAFAWIVVRWLRTSSTIDAAVAGVLLYTLVFFEPLPLVMGLFFVIIAGAALLRGTMRPRTFAIQSAAMLAFFALTAVIVYETTGFDLVQAFRQIGAHAVEFNEVAGRPYAVWVRANLAEFLVGAGPAAVVLAVIVPAAAWSRRSSIASWFAQPVVATSLGVLAVLLITDLIGINRGEVIRLWIFLACFFQLPAAWACVALQNRGAILALLTVAVAHSAIGVATIGFVFP
jgi:hypothetical protein